MESSETCTNGFDGELLRTARSVIGRHLPPIARGQRIANRHTHLADKAAAGHQGAGRTGQRSRAARRMCGYRDLLSEGHARPRAIVADSDPGQRSCRPATLSRGLPNILALHGAGIDVQALA